MNIAPLNFLITGARQEANRFAFRCISESESPERVAAVKTPGDEPFVYSVYLIGNKAMPNRFAFLKEIPPEAMEGIRSGKGVLVIDCSNEGPSANPKWMVQLHQMLRELAIPPRKVVFLTQNRKFPNQLAKWKETSGEPEVIHGGYYHSFMRDMITYVANEVVPSGEFESRRRKVLQKIERNEVRDKHYLCLNFTPRFHRITTMLYLLKNHLLEKGLVSFSGLQNRKLDYRERVYDEIVKVPFPDLEALSAYIPELIELGPLQLDTDPMAAKSPVVNVGEFWYYEKTYFSLVTESGIQGNEFRRFTEKVFKPMLGLHPFLILGLPHTLHDLREFGFRTFDEFINPAYDGIEDSVSRMTALLAEFERLCQLPLPEMDTLYRQMLPDIWHNYDYFAGDLRRVFVERVENPLLEQLRRVALTPVAN